MSDMRDEFEKWAESEFPHMKLTRKGDTGEYLYKTAHFAWSAWQAARAQGEQGVDHCRCVGSGNGCDCTRCEPQPTQPGEGKGDE